MNAVDSARLAFEEAASKGFPNNDRFLLETALHFAYEALNAAKGDSVEPAPLTPEVEAYLDSFEPAPFVETGVIIASPIMELEAPATDADPLA